MEDREIVELYFARLQCAISETAKKYGNYCYKISYNILENNEDCEECVNDTYMKAWLAMPPEKPRVLSVFLGRITRNLSLDKYRSYSAKKRGAGQLPSVFEELANCIASENSIEDSLDEMELTDALNAFLQSQSEENRNIFIRRYWYFSSINEIADTYGLSESKVKMSLLRSRKKLKNFLEKEGISL